MSFSVFRLSPIHSFQLADLQDDQLAPDYYVPPEAAPKRRTKRKAGAPASTSTAAAEKWKKPKESEVIEVPDDSAPLIPVKK